MNHSQWQEHIEAFAQTNLSKTAYTKEHDLSYHQLLYHVAKSEKANASPEEFVQVSLKAGSSSSECLGILEVSQWHSNDHSRPECVQLFASDIGSLILVCGYRLTPKFGFTVSPLVTVNR